MRSRLTRETLLWSAASCHRLAGQACHSGLSARGAGDGARRVGQSEFGGAIVTKPNQNMWSIRPEEGTYFAGDLHRIVNTETLQRLNVKYAIVKLAFSAFVPVNTLPLTKQLSRHINYPSFSAHHAETLKPLYECRGVL